MSAGNKFKPGFFGEVLDCGRNMHYPIDWSLIPTFLTVTEITLWCWGKPFMVFSASPKTAEKNQLPKRTCSYISHPVLHTTMALAVQVMRFPISIWILTCLSVSLMKERLNPAFICTSAFHWVQWSWPRIVDFHLMFKLQYHSRNGCICLCKVSFHIKKTVFNFCSHI